MYILKCTILESFGGLLYFTLFAGSIFFMCVLVAWIGKRDVARQKEADFQHQQLHQQLVMQEHQKKLQPQIDLFNRYANSPLLQTILSDLEIGRTCLPEEIAIYDDRIQATVVGQCRTYGFAVHRVPFLEPAYESCNLNDFQLDYVLRPQIAMADAINYLLGDEYDIIDKASFSSEECHHSDGESYYWRTYKSNYVILRRKAVNAF